MSELTVIGIKINAAIEGVRRSGLTVEELRIFEDYILHQETCAPILNPSLIQKYGFSMFDQAKKRIELLKPILELEEQ
ncbi:hypothetical protein ES703_107057 [subsurface metagenome]